jgi:hypothetical protein
MEGWWAIIAQGEPPTICVLVFGICNLIERSTNVPFEIELPLSWCIFKNVRVCHHAFHHYWCVSFVCSIKYFAIVPMLLQHCLKCKIWFPYDFEPLCPLSSLKTLTWTIDSNTSPYFIHPHLASVCISQVILLIYKCKILWPIGNLVDHTT